MATFEIKFLSDDEIQKLHDTSIRILENIGLKIHSEEVLGRLRGQSGLSIDQNSRIVKFREHAVMEAIAQIPNEFTIFGRDQSKRVRYGGKSLAAMSIPGEAQWVEPHTKTRRDGTMADFEQSVVVADALPHIDVVGAMIRPAEMPIEIHDVCLHAELLKRTRKPVRGWVSNRTTARYILEMFKLIAGGSAELRNYPLSEFGLEPISPLELPGDGLEAAIEFAQAGLPVVLGPMPQAMATAPVTLAGAVALGNAEALGALAVVQALAPRTPMIYFSAPHIMDPRTMSLVFSSPEQGLMATAVTQLGKHYGLPVGNNVGLTDSKLPDAQAGLEKGTTLLIGALSGANAFDGMGISGCDQGFSLPQLVLDDEIIGFVKRTVRGMRVDDESCAYEVIERVGIGGNFLLDNHTLTHWRDEFWIPKISDRYTWEKWQEMGGKTMLERAVDRQEQILSEHTLEWLDEEAQQELDGIVSAAKKDVLGL